MVNVGTQDFIPADRPHPFFGEHPGNAVRKHNLEVRERLDALLLHERLNMGNTLPVLFVAHFVAANVDDSPGKREASSVITSPMNW